MAVPPETKSVAEVSEFTAAFAFVRDPRSLKRFAMKVERTDGCWFWRGSHDTCGYDNFRENGRIRKAHQCAYEWAFGPIQQGLELDHLCRARDCVRPSHLEAVSHRVNALRGRGVGAINALKTHCPMGHELELVRDGSHRVCRRCRRERDRDAYHRSKANIGDRRSISRDGEPLTSGDTGERGERQ